MLVGKMHEKQTKPHKGDMLLFRNGKTCRSYGA